MYKTPAFLINPYFYVISLITSWNENSLKCKSFFHQQSGKGLTSLALGWTGISFERQQATKTLPTTSFWKGEPQLCGDSY